MEPFERELARFVAGRRNDEAERLGKRVAFGFDGDPLEIHVIGALGEMATAKALGCYWGGSVNTFRAPDLPGNIQVRTRTKPTYQLLVRPGDKDTDVFVHVIAETRGRVVPSVCDIRGWAFGYECKKVEYLRSWGNRPAAHFVPDKILHPIESLGQSLE